MKGSSACDAIISTRNHVAVNRNRLLHLFSSCCVPLNKGSLKRNRGDQICHYPQHRQSVAPGTFCGHPEKHRSFSPFISPLPLKIQRSPWSHLRRLSPSAAHPRRKGRRPLVRHGALLSRSPPPNSEHFKTSRTKCLNSQNP